eukprot:188034_1
MPIIISQNLKTSLERLPTSISGSRFLKVEVSGSELIRVPHEDGGVRAKDWKRDFNNVGKYLKERSPCFIVFYAPKETQLKSTVNRGYGYRSGGLDQFLTSNKGSPAVTQKNLSWKSRNQNNPRNFPILILHCPPGTSSSLRSSYEDAKDVLMDYLGDDVSFERSFRRKPELNTPHARSSSLNDLPLAPWERQSMLQDIEAAKLSRETKKIGGFLADMHKQGGAIGVKSSLADELCSKIGTNTTSNISISKVLKEPPSRGASNVSGHNRGASAPSASIRSLKNKFENSAKNTSETTSSSTGWPPVDKSSEEKQRYPDDWPFDVSN